MSKSSMLGRSPAKLYDFDMRSGVDPGSFRSCASAAYKIYKLSKGLQNPSKGVLGRSPQSKAGGQGARPPPDKVGGLGGRQLVLPCLTSPLPALPSPPPGGVVEGGKRGGGRSSRATPRELRLKVTTC